MEYAYSCHFQNNIIFEVLGQYRLQLTLSLNLVGLGNNKKRIINVMVNSNLLILPIFINSFCKTGQSCHSYSEHDGQVHMVTLMKIMVRCTFDLVGLDWFGVALRNFIIEPAAILLFPTVSLALKLGLINLYHG